MASERELPEDRNPMLAEERAPSHEILVERRCLGQTELKVKPGQVGTSNATKPDNLGVLDYAHLRVPLPADLGKSGIFAKGPNRKYPEAYFLMRRSSDGFISATGMFKAAFPYASVDEEVAEKDYIKTLPDASTEEVAGNVWVHPDQALELAEEYGVKLWIAALLDPEPITHGTSNPDKSISSPPSYRMKETANGAGRSPEKKSVRSTRGRSMRSESPQAQAKTPGRKYATPRKARKGKGSSSGSTTLAKVEEDAGHDDEGAGSVNGDAELDDEAAQAQQHHQLQSPAETVKVEVETTVQPSANGGEDVETTKVNIEMPFGHPDLKLPQDTEGMLAEARAMVKEAERISGGSGTGSSGKGKRKAEEMLEDDEDDEEESSNSLPAAKRVRVAEVELRKEKIKRRAITGIATSLALGALLPSLLAAFPWS